jgi:glycolate oxidase FAD binding subunit
LRSVSEPASVTEAAELLATCTADGRRVAIEKEGGDVVLSTLRLDRVLEHEAGDLTAIVEAGVRLSELDAVLAERGQMLALDPPGDPTIGACLAGDLSGPRRHRYGSARDLVIGVTVVLADGSVASSGGKVVKNVAGYDLGKLFSGSNGTLGLVARLCVRLHPRPAAARTLLVEVDRPEEAQRLARAILHSQLVPSAVDLLWPGQLAVLFEGSGRAVETQLGAARALLGGDEDDGSVWEKIARRQLASGGRVSFAPGELAVTLERLPEAVVRVGTGSAYGPQAPADDRGAELLALTERVRAEFDPGGVLV